MRQALKKWQECLLSSLLPQFLSAHFSLHSTLNPFRLCFLHCTSPQTLGHTLNLPTDFLSPGGGAGGVCMPVEIAPQTWRLSRANVPRPEPQLTGSASCSLPAPLPQGGQLQVIANQHLEGYIRTSWHQNNLEGKGCSDLWSPGIGHPALPSGSPTHTVPKVGTINVHPDLGCPGVKQCRNQQAGPHQAGQGGVQSPWLAQNSRGS